MNINHKIAGYFKTHPKVNEFWLTSDFSAFFNENNATMQSKNLAKQGKPAGITKFTRDEIVAWEAEEAKKGAAADTGNNNPPPPPPPPAPELTPAEKVTAAQTAFDNATAALKAAQDAKAALAADATAVAKTAATKAVTAATKAVADAQADLDNAKLDAGQA